MNRPDIVTEAHLRLLAEAANDRLERVATARQFAVRTADIKCDRRNRLSYSRYPERSSSPS